MSHQKLHLRGHHLAVFAVNYWGDKFYASTLPSYNHPLSNEYPKKKLRQNKPLKKEENVRREYEYSNSTDLITSVYGERMKSTLNLMWHLLKTQPDLEVEIVEGLDSICRANCPNLAVLCAQVREGDEDQTTLEAYKLKVGETYTARELVQRVIEFSQRSGLRSPRDKILAQSGNLRFLC